MDDFWRILVRVDEQPPDENKVPERDRAKIEVNGSMSDERRERLREALLNRYLSTRTRTVPKPITREAIEEMEKLPDVAESAAFRTGEAWLGRQFRTPGNGDHPSGRPARRLRRVSSQGSCRLRPTRTKSSLPNSRSINSAFATMPTSIRQLAAA